MKEINSYSFGANLKFAVTAAAKALPNTPVLLRDHPYRQLFHQAKQLGCDGLELHLRTPEVSKIERLMIIF